MLSAKFETRMVTLEGWDEQPEATVFLKNVYFVEAADKKLTTKSSHQKTARIGLKDL